MNGMANEDGFPVLPQNYLKSNRGWCTWHHREGCVEVKQKTASLMALVAA
jgi:hypothetical protein